MVLHCQLFRSAQLPCLAWILTVSGCTTAVLLGEVRVLRSAAERTHVKPRWSKPPQALPHSWEDAKPAVSQHPDQMSALLLLLPTRPREAHVLE